MPGGKNWEEEGGIVCQKRGGGTGKTNGEHKRRKK